MKITNAKGVTGFILITGFGTPVFRVYHEGAEFSFTDYEIHIHDFEVTITDEDATLYEGEGKMKNVLDYSQQTLVG